MQDIIRHYLGRIFLEGELHRSLHRSDRRSPACRLAPSAVRNSDASATGWREFPCSFAEPNDSLRPFMATILLEDNFSDNLGKAQRWLKLHDEQLAKRAGASLSDLGRAQSGERGEKVIRKLAASPHLPGPAPTGSATRAPAPDP